MTVAGSIASFAAASPDLVAPGSGEAVEVAVDAFLVDLVRVDAADQSIEADFVITLSWSDPRLEHDSAKPRTLEGDTFWQPQILVVQARRLLTVVWEAATVDGKGTVTVRRRYAGPLSNPMDLSAFPFDRHVIRLSFASPGARDSDIRFVPDESHTGRAPSLTVPDWSIGDVRIAVASYEVPGTGVSLPGFSLEIPAERLHGFYIWGVLSPLVVIIAMSWAVFWLDPAYVTQKVGIATTSILTLIAYRFALGTQLPKLSYLTRMDYFTLGSTILIFLAFLKVALETSLVHGGREAVAARIDRVCRWAFPAGLGVLILVSFAL